MQDKLNKNNLIGKKRKSPDTISREIKKDNFKKGKKCKRQLLKEKIEKDGKKNELDLKNMVCHQESNLKNEKFEYYYKTQFSKLFQTPEKFEEFITKLREKLPCLFLINKAHPFHEGYRNFLLDESFLKKILGDQYNLIKIEIKNLINYKECLNLVYNININRMELKENGLFKNFHTFIQFGVDGGVISRQEAVNVIPPILMQASPKDHLLEMSAAHGSKSAQCLETIYEKYDFLDKNII